MVTFAGTLDLAPRNNVYKGGLLNEVGFSGNIFSEVQNNYSGKGVLVFIRVLAITGTLTVSVLARDAFTGTFATMLSSAALAAPGITLLTVYPGVEVIANQQASNILPFEWLLRANVAGGTADFQVSTNLIV